MGTARDEILGKLKNANHAIPVSPDFLEPVFYPVGLPLDLAFKENLEKISGKVYLFETEEALYNKLKALLLSFPANSVFCSEDEIATKLSAYEIQFQEYTGECEELEAGITGCEFLVAHTGSVMVSSAQKGGRQLFVYPPVHIVIARKSQLAGYLKEAYTGIAKKYKGKIPSQITLITGASRTADIEKTLVIGAHGPKELWVLIS